MEKIKQIEELYLDGGEYRQSFLLKDGLEAIEILSKVKNTKAQDIILANLENITCVSKNVEGVVNFYIMSSDSQKSVGYKIVEDEVIVKTYHTTPPEGYTFSVVPETAIFLYGVSTVQGEEVLDIYTHKLSETPLEFSGAFLQVGNKEGFNIFYGCKMRRDGTTFRHKTFRYCTTIAEQQRLLLMDVDIAAASSELREEMDHNNYS
jgi:hypothetical protein